MVTAEVPVSRYVDGGEPVATSTSRIRRRLQAAFAQWGLPAEIIEKALLVVEELVANAVDHARTPFRLTVDLREVPGSPAPDARARREEGHRLTPLARSGRALRIAVDDQCPQPVSVRPFDACAARGRGLQMIEALTSRWGCDRTAAGKTVWALLPA
jgi:two-component sensor histidine kinase